MLKYLIIAIALALPTVAHAQYEAKPGNRALPLYGSDVVNRQWVDLEDYRGKWVLVEFWATW
jgi:hypothetical protein